MHELATSYLSLGCDIGNRPRQPEGKSVPHEGYYYQPAPLIVARAFQIHGFSKQPTNKTLFRRVISNVDQVRML